MSRLVGILQSSDPSVRDTAIEVACREMDVEQLLAECHALDGFRRRSDNLYERVRALFFLYAIHRFELPARPELPRTGNVSYDGWRHLLDRRFEEALAAFLTSQRDGGASDAVSSALAAAYRGLAFQTLADQVRSSVRSAAGNRWMFRVGHPSDQPLDLRKELLERGEDGAYPLLREKTAVRMDLTHSAWSDIFFLGMDYPEGARVINASVDLGVRGRDPRPEPPIETFFRVIDEPVIRLCSVDLGATADISELDEMFDFARDYLGLLKAAVIAAGLVPPGLEGSQQSLGDLLAQMIGPGLGFELTSRVRDIPKGSRLAVSTNLLASLISVCMRATGQSPVLEGPLEEPERRVAAARAILGEWIGGSGGGWQDSGGIWPGLKLIRGETAQEGDPEFGRSRGRLLPVHELLQNERFSTAAREQLQRSLVLVHGGMAQNVGPILELVTEKYLLRSADEWEARERAVAGLDKILEALAAGDISAVADLTTKNFFGPIRDIIPWATNAFTEDVIQRVRDRFGDGFHGFCMLGGMAGGGMGFFFDPDLGDAARDALQEILIQAKRDAEDGVPFAMDPVVYDFRINDSGTSSELLRGDDAMLPASYYSLVVPGLLRSDVRELSPCRRGELARLGVLSRTRDELRGVLPDLIDRMLPASSDSAGGEDDLDTLLRTHGFDSALHERIRADLLSGRIGLAQNRLSRTTRIRDVRDSDVLDVPPESARDLGERAIADGQVGVITLSGGAASRWTKGAGVVKGIDPFCRLGGRHRTFVEIHLAKSRRIGQAFGKAPVHVFTTSLFTHSGLSRHLEREAWHGFSGPRRLSPGRAVGLRMVPTERDLRFLWEETAHQTLDEQAEKMRASVHAALIGWARSAGEASDYRDNRPISCMHPAGHWFEVPNMLRNGVLADLLERRPNLRYLLIHNIDTVGADLDPARLGAMIAAGHDMAFEVVPRRIDDIGGGLARVDGRPRIVEGLAMPDDRIEFGLRYYNTGTSWLDLDAFFRLLELGRDQLRDQEKVTRAVRTLAERMPTYVTIKDVKKRWGHGQEDVFPVTQFEKLWGDMTTLDELDIGYQVVTRARGQQLKDPAQLDGWLRDGSAEFVQSLCDFES